MMMSASKGGSAPSIRYRPIFGGPFGRDGRYVMATMACIERGLHSVRYMVLHPRSGGVLSVANDKTEALAQARRVLKAAAKLTAANAESFIQGTLWAEHEMPDPAPAYRCRPRQCRADAARCLRSQAAPASTVARPWLSTANGTLNMRSLARWAAGMT